MNKITMKKLTKIALITVTAGISVTVAHAQIKSGDIILGFTSPSATQDYVVDLGNMSSLGDGATHHLGSLIDLTQFGGAGHTFPSVNGTFTGVMFGQQVGIPGDLAGISVVRNGAAFNPANPAPGASDVLPTLNPPSGNNVTAASTDASSLALGNPLQSDGFSFTSQSAILTAGSFANNLQWDPRSQISGTIITMDLFESTRQANVGRGTVATPYTYYGTLVLDLTGPNAVADFTGAAAVPEPSTCVMLVGAGLLLVVLRRRFTGAKAV
jgi:hypothetical protein